MTESTASTAATASADTGNTSRGRYTLFSRGMLVIRLLPPDSTAALKNVHGIKPRYAKSGYGTPPVSTVANFVKTIEKTSMSMSGVTSAHAAPSTACL